MGVRVYQSTTLDRLRAVVTAARIEAPFHAHAVTAAVRAGWAEGSEEELEYTALCLAADGCRALWAPQDARRRVVLVLEVATAAPVGADDDDDEGEGDPSLVVVSDPVEWARVVAVHADLAEVDADAGAEEDLCWFATQEVDQLLGA